MRFSKKAFVIVDAYTTGRFLAPYLNANGYACIHVQSRVPVISVYLATFSREHFIDNLIYADDLNALIEQLKSYEIKAVIPGAETGVMLADQLGEALNLATSNGTHSSLARRDKYEMVSKLVQQGIPHAESFKSDSIDEILDWVTRRSIFPVVVKPLASSGTFGVKVCDNLNDVQQAYKDIIHQGNVFNETNTAILIQQFLQGQEYIVNTVSFSSNHKVVDVWRKFKKLVNGIPINDYSELVSSEESVYAQLSAYISSVLNALEIKFGAAHSEAILTEQGPILIETAARLAGSIDPSAVAEALGDNQVNALLKSYINPDEFLRCHTIKLKKYVRHIFFISPLSGDILNSPNLQPVINLPSFHSLAFRFDQGDQLVKTTSLADFPGFIYLVSDNQNQLEKDYDEFRQIEKTLYPDMLRA